MVTHLNMPLARIGYPKDEAVSVAKNAIVDWLLKNDMDVYLVIFDKLDKSAQWSEPPEPQTGKEIKIVTQPTLPGLRFVQLFG